MGFGCNAAGVVATRVIDSPRERLIAIITNNFSLCNGRWPTQILIAAIYRKEHVIVPRGDTRIKEGDTLFLVTLPKAVRQLLKRFGKADEHTKPIGIAFALAGLYLFLERSYTGREVQRAHMKLGQAGGPWPRFSLPDERGAVTAAEVLANPAGEARTSAIRRWCASVWEPWSIHRARVIAMLQAHRIIP